MAIIFTEKRADTPNQKPSLTRLKVIFNNLKDVFLTKKNSIKIKICIKSMTDLNYNFIKIIV